MESFIDFGQVRLPVGLHVLGRGWSGNVFLVETRRWGVAAVKALHPGSRRRSMLREAVFWSAAARLGVAPRLYAVSRLLILYKPVLGPMLSRYSGGYCLPVLSRILVKAFLLDTIGVSHNELARPGGQVVVDTCESPPEPYIIDYDSSTLKQCPSNVTQLIGGLSRVPCFRSCRSIPLLVRSLLRQYRREGCSLETFHKLYRGVLETCSLILDR